MKENLDMAYGRMPFADLATQKYAIKVFHLPVCPCSLCGTCGTKPLLRVRDHFVSLLFVVCQAILDLQASCVP